MTIAGASGIVGSSLIAHARQHNFRFRVLSRRATQENVSTDIELFQWSPGTQESEPNTTAALEGARIIVNLAGASIAHGRLSTARKKTLLQSRLDATSALVKAYQACTNPPDVWIQASAIGYYGDRGEEEVTEESDAAKNWFLADLCQQWESAARQITLTSGKTPRLIIARIGLVLAKEAPAWRAMLLPFRLGVGGKLGNGQQWYSWIDAEDLASAMLHLAHDPTAHGIYNFTAPEPIQQVQLSHLVSKQLHRPALVRVPKLVLRAVLGEAADSLVLASCKVRPLRLLSAEFSVKYPTLRDALPHLM